MYASQVLQNKYFWKMVIFFYSSNIYTYLCWASWLVQKSNRSIVCHLLGDLSDILYNHVHGSIIVVSFMIFHLFICKTDALYRNLTMARIPDRTAFNQPLTQGSFTLMYLNYSKILFMSFFEWVQDLNHISLWRFIAVKLQWKYLHSILKTLKIFPHLAIIVVSTL